MSKDSQENIAYRKAMRENYLNEKRIELIKEWERRDRIIFWDIKNIKK